jgi:hypothetical protein
MAQGNALGYMMQRTFTLKGQNKLTRRGASCDALSGRMFMNNFLPGRCPGLTCFGLSALDLGSFGNLSTAVILPMRHGCKKKRPRNLFAGALISS